MPRKMKDLIDVLNEKSQNASLFKIKDLLDKDTLQTFVKKYHKEQDAQIPLAKILQQEFTVIRETEVDAFVELTNREEEEQWRIDYVFEDNKECPSSIVPLEFKYDGSATEIRNDIKKIHAYLRHFEDVYVSGLLLIRTARTIYDNIDISTSTLKYHKHTIYTSSDLDVSLLYVRKSDVRLMSKNPMQLSQIVSTRKKEHLDDTNIVFIKI